MIILIVFLNSGSGKKPEKPQQPPQTRITEPHVPRNTGPNEPKLSKWEIRERELLTELRRDYNPADIHKNTAWQDYMNLVREAEQLAGVRRGDDARARIQGNQAQLKKAKTALKDAEGILKGNSLLNTLTTKFSGVLTSDGSFAFVSEWMNRKNQLMLKLKSVN